MARIMIIDDSPVVLAAASKHLQEAGHEVITQDKAFGAGSIIYAKRPDIVLLDIQMRILTGEKLLEIIRTTPSIEKTVVIFHSSTPSAELEALKVRYHANGYLQKGDMTQLAERLKPWLGK